MTEPTKERTREELERAEQELKRTLEDLKEREQRFRDLAQASFDAMYVSENGIVVEANDACVRLFGYTDAAGAIGKPATDFVAEESRAEVEARVAKGLEGAYQVMGLRQDGTRFLLEATARMHYRGTKRVRVVVLRDVTEQRSFEDQLRHARKMETAGQLTGAVAHDFNNLLAVISLLAEMMIADTPEGDERRDDLRQIHSAATAATNLTKQLLTFSRKDARRPVPLAVDEVVHSTTRLLSRLIGEGITIDTALASSSCVVYMDPGELEQVLMNLILNARDAMPGGGRVSIETGSADLGINYVLISVKDTGIGMDPATRARIFDPFFTTKPPDAGTGIGLTTVKSIVLKSGGFIEVDSAPGKGSAFRVYLPSYTGRNERKSDELPDVRPPKGTETVLVVDDTDLLRTMVARMLEGQGYNVLSTSSTAAAIELASQPERRIDVLVTDVVMPGMSGPVLSEAIGRFQPRMKTLYMSGYSNDKVLRNGIIPQYADFIQKPFTVVQLARRVRELIDR
jgi:two-component system cell cycle sensor histidine kinase/response regulator CckA